MVLSRKIEEVIEKGGEVKTNSKPLNKFKTLSQRVRIDLLDRMDVALKSRPGLSRTAWIQEAILEKLKRLEE
jgi:hypothetical protein